MISVQYKQSIPLMAFYIEEEVESTNGDLDIHAALPSMYFSLAYSSCVFSRQRAIYAISSHKVSSICFVKRGHYNCKSSSSSISNDSFGLSGFRKPQIHHQY